MSAPDETTPTEPVPRHGVGRLALGLFGRTWLAFLGGVLLVTLLPLLLGWRPYVVETASMEPAIRPGDVVISSPYDDPAVLAGRVIVFESPDRPETDVTHRVIGINDDGTLVTKGDANRSPDSTDLAPDRVHGLGRLLVRGAGLPMLWLAEGAWLHLMLLAVSIAIAVLGVVRDDEDEVADETVDDPADDPAPTPWRVPVLVPVLPRARRDAEPSTAAPERAAPATVALPRSRRGRVLAVTGLPTDRTSSIRSARLRDAEPRDTGPNDRQSLDDEAHVGEANDHEADRDEPRRSEDGSDRDDGPPGPSPPPVRRRTIRRNERGRARNGAGNSRTVFGVLVVGLVALVGPTTAAAAFSGTTNNVASAWSVPDVDYATEITSRSPYLYWRLDETGGRRAFDSSGNANHGRYDPNGNGASFTRLADGALLTDTPDRAVQLNRPDSCLTTRRNVAISGPQVFSAIVWFRAPAGFAGGGKLIGFERPQRGVASPPSGDHDRHLYLDGNGLLWFAVDNGGRVALSSPTALNDGEWHMAVGTQGPAGMALYVDGVQVATNANTAAGPVNGWWRAGCGNLAGWGNQWTGPNNPGTNSGVPRNRPFLGALDEITVYSGTALTPLDVVELWFAR